MTFHNIDYALLHIIIYIHNNSVKNSWSEIPENIHCLQINSRAYNEALNTTLHFFLKKAFKNNVCFSYEFLFKIFPICQFAANRQFIPLIELVSKVPAKLNWNSFIEMWCYKTATLDGKVHSVMVQHKKYKNDSKVPRQNQLTKIKTQRYQDKITVHLRMRLCMIAVTYQRSV